jgi:hypothetical protein
VDPDPDPGGPKTRGSGGSGSGFGSGSATLLFTKPNIFARPRNQFLPYSFKTLLRDFGHEQLISNGGRFKSTFAKRDKKRTMIDLRGIPTNWFKNQLCPSIRLSRLSVQK